MGALQGRTILVTGAGRGIGRAEALFLAEAGANLVVNDPGVAIDGSGGDGGIAAGVVDEIRHRGGSAVADTGSVTDWAAVGRMVEKAVAEFGDLHGVVNNATIEVNKGLERLTEAEFDDVVAVKLKGSFAVSHWATAHWRRRFDKGVRADRAIVNTVSGSGLLNPLPAQSNYAAANAGVAAMSEVHALELHRLGVRVNCVSPSMVRTRLTRGVPGMDEAPPDGELDPQDPAVVAPLVGYLLGDGCPLTGQVLSVRGDSIVVNQGWSPGARLSSDGGPWTIGRLADGLESLALPNPFDRLGAAIGGTLGTAGRSRFQAMVDAELDKP